ncbi:hypothetical protein scyTo_0008703, partial [Scyliorhinus torazame]|nr:hypothetical protein [Scyliorhinus torazame]
MPVKPKKKTQLIEKTTIPEVLNVHVIFPNEESYEGECTRTEDGTLERNGFGTHMTPSGIIYTGQWKNDKKHQRLLHEMKELAEEVEQIKNSMKESASEEKLTPVALANQVASLKQHLVAPQLEKVLDPNATIDLTDPEGVLVKCLLTQLDVAKSGIGPTQLAGRFPGSAGKSNVITYELYYEPEQTRFTQKAKVAELEKRLADLEAAVGTCSNRQNSLSIRLQGTCLMGTLEVPQSKVSTMDPVTLDPVEARLQSVLAKLNEVAKHKAATRKRRLRA